jgi:pimeloyl-ACP methyl ester carboxylesterase
VNKTRKEHVVIDGSQRRPIGIDYTFPLSGQLLPVVVFVHGFKGFKDWGHFNQMADVFAEAGFMFVKFNFSFNGTTPQTPVDFSDLDAFGKNNYLIELDDLNLVIDWVCGNKLLQKIADMRQIFLLGHSRGGAIAVLKTAEDRRIKKLVTWAAVSDLLNRNTKKTIPEWKEKGVVYTYNMRTEQKMPLYLQFYETLEANRERLDVCAQAAKISVPWLIIHGSKDEAVSAEDARELHDANQKSTLLLVEGNHTFGAMHPAGDKPIPALAQEVISATIEWVNVDSNHLQG